MSMNPQVTATDQTDASINRGHAWVGQAFFFADELTRELRSILSRQSDLLLRGPWGVGLQGRDKLELPGYEIRPFSLPKLRLRSVTTDRAIYDHTDEVHVLAVDLTDPTSDHVLSVRANESEYTRLPIELDTSGCRPITLRDLPAGEYDIEWDGERRCSFTVAAYRLAPLVGSVVEQRWNDETKQLLVTLRLESFGLPVHSPVKLERQTTYIHVVNRRPRNWLPPRSCTHQSGTLQNDGSELNRSSLRVPLI